MQLSILDQATNQFFFRVSNGHNALIALIPANKGMRINIAYVNSCAIEDEHKPQSLNTGKRVLSLIQKRRNELNVQGACEDFSPSSNGFDQQVPRSNSCGLSVVENAAEIWMAHQFGMNFREMKSHLYQPKSGPERENHYKEFGRLVFERIYEANKSPIPKTPEQPSILGKRKRSDSQQPKSVHVFSIIGGAMSTVIEGVSNYCSYEAISQDRSKRRKVTPSSSQPTNRQYRDRVQNPGRDMRNCMIM